MTATSSCTFDPHAGFIFHNGLWAAMSHSHAGSGCPTNSTESFWKIGTNIVTDCHDGSNINDTCLGHNSPGYNYFVFFAPLSASWNERTDPSNPTTFTNFFQMSNLEDGHYSQNNVDSLDSTPVVGTSFTQNNPGPQTAPDREVFAVRRDGTVARFTHTFGTGPNVCTKCTFAAQYVIGAVSQDGRFFSWSSDMNQGLGTDGSGVQRSDVFVVRLD